MMDKLPMLTEEMLLEVTRAQLNSKNKGGAHYAASNQGRGKNRYERRKYSSISRSVKAYNQMDMNSLFKYDILTIVLDVQGETNNYKVKVKFGGIINELQREIERNNGKIEYKVVHYALQRVFDSGDVYIWCSCDDFKYRFNHWSFKNGYAIEKGNSDPGPGKGIANPDDDKGAGCKHTALVLANVRWLVNVSSTISNYIHYMEEHYENLYARLMFPKLYGMPYDKAVQLELGDNNRDYLRTGKSTLNKSNVTGKDRGKFKKGNQSGIQFTKNGVEDNDQLELDLGDEESEEI